MKKLADISAFEALQSGPGASDMAVFNDGGKLIGMSDLSDNIYEYIKNAASEIVAILAREYQRPKYPTRERLNALASNIFKKRAELGESFSRFLVEEAINGISQETGVPLRLSDYSNDDEGLFLEIDAED